MDSVHEFCIVHMDLEQQSWQSHCIMLLLELADSTLDLATKVVVVVTTVGNLMEQPWQKGQG